MWHRVLWRVGVGWVVQREVQQGVFMILCLRGRREELGRQRVKAIQQELEAGPLGRRVLEALRERRRRPFVDLEFPLVAGAQADDVAGGVAKLVEGLRAVLGLAGDAQVGGTGTTHSEAESGLTSRWWWGACRRASW